jgi:tRNA threonylcarbamoyladenosine biosynthesis protein TsaB
MKILALDSSAVVASVALCDGETMLAEYTLNNGNTHSETLLPMIETMLSHFGITVDDIDLFAASTGPGSFTGVRIGAATLKGLAFAKNTPCVGVSTLEALAENAVALGGLICPVMNARRSQVYTALFRSDGKTLTRLMPDSALSITELDELLATYGEPVIFVGDGYEIVKRALRDCGINAKNTPKDLILESAASVARCAYRAYLSGEYIKDTELSPTYLRLPQAERERLEKLNKGEEK